jgi:predicted nucleotidyltransferase
MFQEEIVSIVAEYLIRQPGVTAAYVFGSVARDNMHACSDVDIAVLFSPGTGEKPALFDRRLQMEMDLGDLIGRPVQVVDYDAASLALRHQIRKYGRLIVDKDPKYRMAKEVSTLRQYLDMLPTYNYCIGAALRRL